MEVERERSPEYCNVADGAAVPDSTLPLPLTPSPRARFSAASSRRSLLRNVRMAASAPSLPPPPAAASTTLAGNLTASSLLSVPPPRPRLAAAHRRAVVAAAASPRPPPPPTEGDGGGGEKEVERAMGMDGGIPGTSGEFLRRVSSRAYGMRRHLMESLDSLAYDGNGSRISTLLMTDRVLVSLVCLGARLRFGKFVQLIKIWWRLGRHVQV